MGPPHRAMKKKKNGHQSIHICRRVQAPNSDRHIMGIGAVLAADKLLYLCPISPEGHRKLNMFNRVYW